MTEQVFSIVTTVVLYAMIGVPFAVWSGRASFASAQAHGGRPSWAATFWLLILPAIFIAGYVVSGIGEVVIPEPDPEVGVLTREVSEWGQWYFLWLPPALGMMIGYAIGASAARR